RSCLDAARGRGHRSCQGAKSLRRASGHAVLRRQDARGCLLRPQRPPRRRPQGPPSGGRRWLRTWDSGRRVCGAVKENNMAETIIDGVTGLKALVGKDLGRTGWQEMTFEAIQKFADATGDHQWIHVDRERMPREPPFGKPLAHGYFTLALIGGLFSELLETKNFAMVVNYGLNKVRFPAPLKAGQRYRLSASLSDVKQS